LHRHHPPATTACHPANPGCATCPKTTPTPLKLQPTHPHPGLMQVQGVAAAGVVQVQEVAAVALVQGYFHGQVKETYHHVYQANDVKRARCHGSRQHTQAVTAVGLATVTDGFSEQEVPTTMHMYHKRVCCRAAQGKPAPTVL
jgi:hypothetical protein